MTSNPDAAFTQAMASLRGGNLPDAERHFKTLLRDQPNHVAALNLMGVLLSHTGRFDEAEDYLRRAIAVNPASDATFYNYGTVLKQLNRPQEAFAAFDRAIAINPSVADTWNNRGLVLNELERHAEAIADFEKAISLKNDYVEAIYNKGKTYFQAENFAAALKAYDEALRLKPDFAEGYVGRGGVFHHDLRYHDALAAFDAALKLGPNLAAAWLGKANSYLGLQRYQQALDVYDEAIRLKPDFAEAWLGKGNTLYALARHKEALADYDKAILLNPKLAEAWLGRGNVLLYLGRDAESARSLERAVEIKPSLPFILGDSLLAQLRICKWDDFETKRLRLVALTENSEPAVSPLVFLYLSSSLETQLQCQKTHALKRFPTIRQPLWQGERYNHDRIRVAYVSADLSDHVVSRVAANVFELHDRSRFELTALNFGPDADSAMRKRLVSAFDRFIDVGPKDDREIAALIRDLEIDIAVDPSGFTKDSRSGIFAHRAAPVQVNWLGFAGTMGVNFIDYVIADETVIRPDEHEFFAESVVSLPDTFFPTDGTRPLPGLVSRSAAGLPESGFVYSCFNLSQKILPGDFDVWMRLLARTPESVLWLSRTNPEAQTNLRREAEARGVSAERIIFAPRTPKVEDHISRFALADLFLDTQPYNAHATASDALWAGVPVLTKMGTAFAGRVAASLLKAAGLPEMIASSMEEYEALAFKLATQPEQLAAIRAKLARNRTTQPLFDAACFTRHLDAAYETMWQRQQRGEAPKSFRVSSDKPAGE